MYDGCSWVCVMLVFVSAGGAPVTDQQDESTRSESSLSTETATRGASVAPRRVRLTGNTTERWYTPCGQGPDLHPTASLEVAPVTGPSLTDILQLADLVTEVASSAKALKYDFKNRRFVDDQVIRDLEQTEIPQYAEELLRVRFDNTSKALNITDNIMMALWLRMSVRKLSWAAAYLVLAQEEESKHERDPFKPRFARTEEDIYKIMCKLLVVLEEMQVNPDVPLTRDVAIPQNIKFPDDSFRRDMRDYLCLRDYDRYLDIFANDISIIANSSMG